MKAFQTIVLLILSNSFMTLAWYGHLKYKDMKMMDNLPLLIVILISWGLAFFEYCLMIPANKIGFRGNGGPFSLIQLKMIQEVISLLVFSLFTIVLFKTETFRPNHLYAFVFLMLAVYFVFKK